MTDYVEQLAAEADAAVAAMRAAARAARDAQARAELMRHMLTTARKMGARPRAEAIAGVVGEWRAAWGLTTAGDAMVAGAMEDLTAAFLDHAAGADAATDARLRESAAALEAAFAARGTSLADEMAWRSQCAHGWWESVAPRPPGLAGAAPRPHLPRPAEGRPFWEAGCADFCR